MSDMTIRYKMQHNRKYFLYKKGKKRFYIIPILEVNVGRDRDRDNERKSEDEDGCRSESEIRSCKGIKNTFI